MLPAQLSQEALNAIQNGIDRGDAIIELENLGVPYRTIALLENSSFRIMFIEDLVKRKKYELLSIKGFGNVYIKQLMDALSRYDEIDKQNEPVNKMIGQSFKTKRKN